MLHWAAVKRRISERKAYVIVALRGDVGSLIEARTRCKRTGIKSCAASWTSAKDVVRTKSIPFALKSRLVTEPCSFRNALCNLACLNSHPRSHTSSSLSFLMIPLFINGVIQETVMYCHGVRLSSGVRRFTVGTVKAGLISPFGKVGSRSGMFKMTKMPKKAVTGARINGISLMVKDA